MSRIRVIITGGAGLIGSNLVRLLNERGVEDILLVDHLGISSKWKNLRDLCYTDYLEKEDFLSRVISGQLPKGYTHVLHMGACSSTTESDASYLIQNNFEYTKVLAEACLDKNVRFLYASSAATYGDGTYGYDDKASIADLRPLNMYGYSKHMFDLYAQKKGYLSKITGVKFFNVFGFGEAHKGDMRSVVLKGYEQILSEGKIRLFKSYKLEYADGEQKRDFLYVKDAAKIAIHLFSGNHFGLFNVGRGVAETWLDLANGLFSALDRPNRVEFVEMPEGLKAKYQYYTKASTEKLLSTGYAEGFTDLKTAIADYVKLLQTQLE
ncbi:ADP-glyceromanno-heptose 6-epimerase [Leptospira inadai serovar Lyme str. 10]|uniref:ADP-L-glycero-D-manno-heptose-6-epimerase n=2 Tax=Leptospira inadai serovar Lyme TaxID=293084 RepID=V6HA14_9LEPT|nr:ADP-glyceromanno-heptose 6-epimerase [Leptospira inadai]EQA36151.1 ADP-glyceromanno-heptose 6-epimerase [Leptospira inadai serovar Lyme str. 10]PNV74875.1 ADP-glyceromanno-heptose 6-epimerase [Leptospira inadai serovar Lyme]